VPHEPATLPPPPQRPLPPPHFSCAADDPTAWLSMVAALDFRRAVPGGEAAVIGHIAQTAAKGGALLATMWGTETLASSHAMLSCLTNVRLPTTNATAAAALGDALLARYHTWVPSFAGERVGLPAMSYWVRVSAFVYNDVDDFEMLGRAVLEILNRVNRE
jgi:selenocysteine lyase/cysteine desulfurase